jgi:hypothetical protein
MTNPGDHDFLHRLEVDVEAEITIAEASAPEDVAATPVAEWQFDPADAERYEVGLRGLLGAVEAVEEAEKGRS